MLVRLLRGMTIGAGAALGLALVAPAPAHAQAQTHGTRFGVEAAFGSNNNVGIGAGAFVKFHLADISEHPITGRVSFDYFFPSSSDFFGYTAHFWEIEGDGLFDITTKSATTKPYVGAGLTYSKWSFSYPSSACTFGGVNYCDNGASTTGLDVLGGINFMANSTLMPFAEVKLDLSGSYGNSGELIIKGGVHFH